MPTSAYFAGQTLVAPNVASVIDDSALAAAGAVASSTVAVVGPSDGGAPNAALTFATAADAAAVLRGGALLDCVRKAFDPGGNSPGAALVIAVRAGSPTQSTFTLLDAGSANSIVLTSTDYGLWTTQIRVKVEAGTTQGKKITVSAPVAGQTQTVVQDNVYRAALSIQYTGAAAASLLTINATQFATVNTGNVDNVTLLFSVYPTLQQIVDALNATGKYTAAVLGSPTAASSTLDGITNQDDKAAPYTSTSTLQACIDFFNGAGEPFITAVKAANATLPPNNTTGFVYLAGGVGSASTALSTGDYTTGLVPLEPQSVGIVLCASGSSAVHATVLAHVNAMSGPAGQSERIGIVGGVVAESVAQVLTRAANLASQRVGLAYPGIKDLDPTGVLITYDPYYTAAAIAGLLAGDSVQRAATFKNVGASAMEVLLSNAQVTSLLLGGVIPVQFMPGRGNRIVQSLSTYTADNNLAHVELSVRRTCDTIAAQVRNNLQALIGRTTGQGLVTEAYAITDATLRLALNSGLLVGTQSSPAYKNIQVSISGPTLRVEFAAQVGVPANYILITAHLSGFAT